MSSDRTDPTGIIQSRPGISGRRLRILHLTAGSDAGGLSRYIYDLCAAMNARGHQVAVAGERGAWHWLFEGAPWPWIDVPLKGGPAALWRSARRLERWLAEHPVDVLHTHYRRPTLVARRLQRRLGLPIIYTVHLSDISLGWPWRWFSDFGDHTHVASEEARRWVVESARIAPQRVTVIPHGIDTGRFPEANAETKRAARAALDLNEKDLVAVYLGRLDVPKNEEWLLDLAASRHCPDGVKILLAGEGPHSQMLRRRIADEGLGNRIRLLGHRDPLPIYQAADAVLLPSAREGFSLMCAEAMSVGVPVLRTRTAGTSELIEEGITGRSVEVDRQAFIEAACDFLSDRAALARMGKAAAHRIRRLFTFDEQVRRTIDLYAHFATLRHGVRP